MFREEVVGETLYNLVLRPENRSKRAQFLGKAIGKRWLVIFFNAPKISPLKLAEQKSFHGPHRKISVLVPSYGTSELVGIWI